MTAPARRLGDRDALRMFAVRSMVVLSTLVLPAIALAAETEGHAEHHGVPWLKLTFQVINLSIFVFILRWGAWPTLRNWVAERRAHIATALAEADRAKREAEALRAEWQRRLDQLGAELESMLKQARADIAAERDQILAAARRTAEAIRRDAERTAASEIRSAQETLRAEIAAQALAIAERLATQRLTAADQQRFVTEFTRQLERQ
jgi:F-type H+-transporting ATPase subunit b